MTTQLLPLETVTPMISSVIRILGGNPGKFTLQGTNTYLISRPIKLEDQSSNKTINCILVDTGEGKESYIGSLSSILQGKDESVGKCKRVITDIILTHWHHDHIGGLPSVLRLLKNLDQKPPKVHKFFNEKVDKHVFDLLNEIEKENLITKSKSDQNLLHPLKDGEIIQIESNSNDSNSLLRSLQIIHSPGHTIDHICLLIKEDGVLLTGDHVLGQGTSVFENLGDYLRSLKKCKEILVEQQEQNKSNSSSDSIGNLYPAHGPLIKEGVKVLQQYTDHRLEREQQILQLLHQPLPSSDDTSIEDSNSYGWSIPDLVSNLYKDYPENLYPAAARGIFLHLHKLASPDPDLQNPKEGQKVICSKVLSSSSSSIETIQTPEVPKDDQSWLGVMDLRWSLIKKHNDFSSL